MRAHGSEPPCSKVKIYIQKTNTIYHFNVIVYSKQKNPDSSTIYMTYMHSYKGGVTRATKLLQLATKSDFNAC